MKNFKITFIILLLFSGCFSKEDSTNYIKIIPPSFVDKQYAAYNYQAIQLLYKPQL